MFSSLLAMLISALFGALILHFSVKIAAGDTARDVTFEHAFWVSIGLWILAGLLSMVPIVGGVLALISTFWLVMSAYKIGFLRSLLVWIVYTLIMGGLTFLMLVPAGLMAFML